MGFLVILFIVCVGGSYWLFKGFGQWLFGSDENSYIDRSTRIENHYHYHEHKNINIVDQDTVRNVYKSIDSTKKTTD